MNVQIDSYIDEEIYKLNFLLRELRDIPDFWTDVEYLRLNNMTQIIVENKNKAMDYVSMIMWTQLFSSLIRSYIGIIVKLGSTLNKNIIWETLCTCLAEMPISQRYAISQLIHTIPETGLRSISDFIELDFKQSMSSGGIQCGRGYGLVTYNKIQRKLELI